MSASATRLRAVRECLADLPADVPVLVACSGGPDSLALAEAAAGTGRPVIVGIVDHGLQPDSARVAQDAARRCRELGIDRVDILPVIVASESGGAGPEAAARAARRTALLRHAEELGAPVILLGHTREDQAETVLLRLARGSGARSLAAMAPVSGPWRRPFLALPRAVVREGVGDAWADPHNTDPRFARTRVRHAALPALVTALGPAVVDGLARSADLLRDDAEALDDLAADWADRWIRTGDAWEIPVSDLVDLPRAIRTRVLRQAILLAGSPATDLTRDHVIAVDRLVSAWRGQGAVALPAGASAARACGRLQVIAAQPAAGR